MLSNSKFILEQKEIVNSLTRSIWAEEQEVISPLTLKYSILSRTLLEFYFHSFFLQRNMDVEMSQSDDEGTYYDEYHKWDALKYTTVVWQTFVMAMGPLFLYSIIWYEQNSADFRYRTIINQLLSQLCYVHIFGCYIGSPLYLAVLIFGPLSPRKCDFITITGRFLYIVCITLISIRHIFKYLYIFKWKYVAYLNDDFFAKLCTYVTLVLGFVFAFTSYFLGYNNEDLDFHICTGNSPLFNINQTLRLMSHPNDTMSAWRPFWFQPDIMSDPIDVYSTIMLLLLLIINIKTWF